MCDTVERLRGWHEAINANVWVIGKQKKKGFSVRMIVRKSKLVAINNCRKGEQIRGGLILVETEYNPRFWPKE